MYPESGSIVLIYRLRGVAEMKKLFCLLLAIAVTMGLAACGSSDGNGSGD